MNNKRIQINASVLFGKPTIKGTRISVEQILAALSEGMSSEEIINEFDISLEDIQACIEYAHKAVSRIHYVNHKDALHA
jgi:uncharacterized protein (DUF433 family)